MSRKDSERQRSDGGVDKPCGHERREVERAEQTETAAVAEYSPTGWRRNVFPIVASAAGLRFSRGKASFTQAATYGHLN